MAINDLSLCNLISLLAGFNLFFYSYRYEFSEGLTKSKKFNLVRKGMLHQGLKVKKKTE